MQLNNAIIVITGAGRGLGREFAYAFAKRGAKVVVSSKASGEVEGIAREIGGTAVQADVTKEDQVEDLAKQAVAAYGRIDVWVNNAGVWIPHAPAEEFDMQRVHEMMEVNLFGTMYGCRAAVRQMKTQRSGAIVNILSTSALKGRPGSSAYAASKWGAAGFMKSLRLEVQDAGILVLGVYPGGMQTGLFGEAKPEDFDTYMLPAVVAEKILSDLERENPEEELIIERPGA